MKKIGFVIPWYSENIPGGAEMELRGLSTHLHESGIEVEILTTCVKEFSADWNINFYPEGTGTVHGFTIRRFKVRKRDTSSFDAVNLKLMNHSALTDDEERIFTEQMINSDELYSYIRERSGDYSLFVFIPYMFGTTYYGIQVCPEKSVLIPCFHDEAYLYIKRFKPVFENAAGIVYNARPEYELANRVFDLSRTRQIVMGIGMETNIAGSANAFREKFGITSPFVLYAGRKDMGKNVHTLVTYFSEYIKRQQTDMRLVLIGGGNIELPLELVRNKRIIDLGFVDIQDKYNAAAAAQLLCQPSKNESFSLVIMESWLCGRPVLVHSDCAVTKNFVCESQAGLYFSNYFEFEGCLNYLTAHDDIADLMGQNGRNYVCDNFSWNVIIKKYVQFFNEVIGNAKENSAGQSEIRP